MNIAENISELVGRTPLVKLNKIAEGCHARIAAKLESYNPCGSVKDRIAYSMILDAEKRRLIDRDTVIIEPTSGNTGIGLAFMCAVRGYRLIITMPESMSRERIKLIKSYGAEVVLTPAEEGMSGSIKKADELARKFKKAYIPQQFKNPSNPEIHRKTTAMEIWNDTDGKIDILVCGVGTGGTITGISHIIKKKKPELITVAVEPEGSNVLSGGKPGPHMIQGIGAGFIPEILDREIIDEIITVSNDDAFMMTKELTRKEGILAGISSGAAAYAALNIARKEKYKDKLIVVIFPDTGERYLSTPVFK